VGQTDEFGCAEELCFGRNAADPAREFLPTQPDQEIKQYAEAEIIGGRRVFVLVFSLLGIMAPTSTKGNSQSG
jgi:hypothetical protein